MAEECIFCCIIEKKTYSLYEDERFIVIPDKFPLSRGHLLVIPKKHCAFFHEMDDEDLMEVGKIIKKIVKSCGFEKYNILQNNGHIQSVFHVHFHIIPCNGPNNALKIFWEPIPIQDDYYQEITANLSKKLRFSSYE